MVFTVTSTELLECQWMLPIVRFSKELGIMDVLAGAQPVTDRCHIRRHDGTLPFEVPGEGLARAGAEATGTDQEGGRWLPGIRYGRTHDPEAMQRSEQPAKTALEEAQSKAADERGLASREPRLRFQA